MLPSGARSSNSSSQASLRCNWACRTASASRREALLSHGGDPARNFRATEFVERPIVRCVCATTSDLRANAMNPALGPDPRQSSSRASGGFRCGTRPQRCGCGWRIGARVLRDEVAARRAGVCYVYKGRLNLIAKALRGGGPLSPTHGASPLSRDRVTSCVWPGLTWHLRLRM